MKFSPPSSIVLGVGLAGALTLPCVPAAMAEDAAREQAQIDELKRLIEEQARQVESLKGAIAEQQKKLGELKRALARDKADAMRGGAAKGAAETAGESVKSEDKLAQAASQPAPPPDKGSTPLPVAPLFEQPGVLTPLSKMVLEPSMQYSYSSSNRVALVGYTVIPALLVGLIDVRETKRNTFTGALTARYGVTNRLELEAKVPYVYRYDEAIGREVFQGDSQEGTFSTSGKGLGDIELAARYQLNDGGVDKPYYIGTLRLKTRTGKDPFEVVLDKSVKGFRNVGYEQELPTGSGFYALQPGITFLYPSDPAVFFGSVSYLHSFKRDNIVRRTTTGDENLGTVQPGGIFGFNFGLGLALNERSSFSIGYDHSSVGKTRQNGEVTATSVRVQLGTLLFGYSYRLNDGTTVNVSVGAGLTRDTPDVTLTLRVPISF